MYNQLGLLLWSMILQNCWMIEKPSNMLQCGVMLEVNNMTE